MGNHWAPDGLFVFLKDIIGTVAWEKSMDLDKEERRREGHRAQDHFLN